MLKRDNKGNRFVQVATNFIGVSLIECLLSPILSKFVLSFYLLCAFKSWLLVIKLHVTRHAFNINQLRAAWIFIGMSICSIFVTAIIMAALSNTMQA